MWIASSFLVIGFTFAIAGCAVDGGDKVNIYYDEISPFVDPATDAINELDELNFDFARLDLNSLSQSEYRQKAENLATVTAETHDKVTAAREGMHDTIPPTQCVEIRDAVFESLQVSEQGLGQLRLYYQLAFSSRDGSRALAESNRLTAEADRIKSSALRVVWKCQ